MINATVEQVRKQLYETRPRHVASEQIMLAHSTPMTPEEDVAANHKCIVFWKPADLCGVATATVLVVAIVPTSENGEFQLLWNTAGASETR